MPVEVTFREAGDQSLLVSFGSAITPESHNLVLGLLESLESSPVPGIVNLHPAYSSLLMQFRALALSHSELEAIVKSRLSSLTDRPISELEIVTIPVCYGGEFGPDLDAVASLHGLSPQRVIELHSSQTYTVYFLGFVPGFAYLGLLPEQLSTPRLPSPRNLVPPGSVGIAARQTAIYPFATPGGWRLLGRTPLILFDAKRPGMSLLRPGAQVRFQPVTPAEFQAALPA